MARKNIEERLKVLGIQLPESPRPLGAYKPCVITGNLIFISGQLPLKNGELKYKGKLGDGITIEEGSDAARIASVNALAIMNSELGSLERVRRIVKVTGFVASAAGFDMQAKVLNGASELFYQIFGENGTHARVAVGVCELPLGAPVEIDVIAEIFT